MKTFQIGDIVKITGSDNFIYGYGIYFGISEELSVGMRKRYNKVYIFTTANGWFIGPNTWGDFLDDSLVLVTKAGDCN